MVKSPISKCTDAIITRVLHGSTTIRNVGAGSKAGGSGSTGVSSLPVKIPEKARRQQPRHSVCRQPIIKGLNGSFRIVDEMDVAVLRHRIRGVMRRDCLPERHLQVTPIIGLGLKRGITTPGLPLAGSALQDFKNQFAREPLLHNKVSQPVPRKRPWRAKSRKARVFACGCGGNHSPNPRPTPP